MKKFISGILAMMIISSSLIPNFALTDSKLITPTLSEVSIRPSTAFEKNSNLISFSGTIKNNTGFKATIKKLTIDANVEYDGQVYKKVIEYAGGEKTTINTSPPTTTILAKSISAGKNLKFNLFDKTAQSEIPVGAELTKDNFADTKITVEFDIKAKTKIKTPLRKSGKNSAKVLKKLKKGTSVSVLSKTVKKYVKVKAGSKKGYVLAKNLKQ